MKKSIVFLLVLLITIAVPAAVKKKRFDVGGAGDVPAATEVVAPAEDAAMDGASVNESAVSVAPAVAEPEKPVKKSESFYMLIAREQ